MCGKPCGKLGAKVWKNKTQAVGVGKTPQNKPSILDFSTLLPPEKVMKSAGKPHFNAC